MTTLGNLPPKLFHLKAGASWNFETGVLFGALNLSAYVIDQL